ncbi:MAG: hypothetical protein Q7K03_06940 [Dehalococcoidia bacterium]|nr:hypothetical protein [Dehalococcoidia bacterium]
MATTEPTINDALAEILAETRSLWRVKGVVRSENTEVLKSSGKRPDILISEPSVSPVVIETEVMPAATVESDALARLGEQLQPSARRILSAVAVRMPLRLREHSSHALKQEISTALDFEMALYTGEDSTIYERWPKAGWLRGSAIDLSIVVQLAAIPPVVIEQAADRLVNGVRESAALLDEIVSAHPGAMQIICQELRQHDGEQTRRMATTILANAFVFHETLARGHGDLADVRTLDELRGMGGGLSKSAILDDWRKILKVNYWPIFDIAKRILEVIPSDNAGALIQGLAATADQLTQSQLMRSHDLTGAVFQRLIADRKFLAAYYTMPASAALLVGMAIRSDRTPANGSWANANAIATLRIADFACGTGTLLTTAYRRISQLHEAAGGDAEALHPAMMASALVGCDVLPAAAHLTASMLAGAHPTVTYNDSSILTMGYGPREKGGVSLGSLDLLDPKGAFEIVDVTSKGENDTGEGKRFEVVGVKARAAEGTGESDREARSTLPHASFDLVLMNPPFTRATDHSGAKSGIPNPMFGAFQSSKTEQRRMSEATEKLFRGTAAHGNAGEGSYFLVLADKKLKPGGTLGLVLPLSLISGDAWEECRGTIRKSYGSQVIVSIAGARDRDCSFSADTGMAECLVVAEKVHAEQKRATFVVLRARPQIPMVGAHAAQQIRRTIEMQSIRKLEDGPVGGTPLKFGDDVIGYAIDAPLPNEGPWNVARVWDLELAQAAYQLIERGRVWLPAMPENTAVSIPMTVVGNIGQVGPHHRDIGEGTATPTGGFRGPFEVRLVGPNAVPSFPVLWAHDAERERCLQFEAESEGVIRQSNTASGSAQTSSKAERIWKTASHCHLNTDFRFNSQSTAMQFTQNLSMGGRAWPSIQLQNEDQEKALATWGNTTLGLLMHWWHSNKQQSGRGSVPITAIRSLPILDVARLPSDRLKKAVEIFEDFKARPLRPFNELAMDVVRRELDERFAVEVIGLHTEVASDKGALGLVRRKLAAEPSISGGKSA